jgi:polyisoprenoid-binding protein YceI
MPPAIARFRPRPSGASEVFRAFQARVRTSSGAAEQARPHARPANLKDPMKPTLALALFLAATVAPAAAQAPSAEAPAPSFDTAAIPAGTYRLDSKEALVRYTTIHMGLTEFWGTFPNATGVLTLDPKAVGSAKVDIKIPIMGVETTNKELNAEFISGEFFDFAKFRQAHFVSTEVVRTGPRTAKVTGDLTLHGITKPVVLNVTFNGAGPNSFSKVLTLGFKAEAVVRRSDFGLGKYVPIVSDETQITISAAFEREAGK